MLKEYNIPTDFYDEMFSSNQTIRKHYQSVNSWFQKTSEPELSARQAAFQKQMIKQGITFTLYNSDDQNCLERTLPFDSIPRIITADEWKTIEAGVKQRVKTLNLFLWDLYHEQNILKEGIIPRKDIVTNLYFRPEMMKVDVPGKNYITLAGIDLIRDQNGSYYILEDNLRTPSGISYVFKNRNIMRHLYPDLFEKHRIVPLSNSLNDFLLALKSMSPTPKTHPHIVLLTPGRYNSAYFEHTFLAHELGIHLVEGSDLKVINHKVYEKTIMGLRQVDVIYRRIDDEFLDPVCFRPDSLLGVPGIMNAFRAGNVALANAPGTGVADDKAIYRFVPQLIRFYLNEEPILANIPTYTMDSPDSLKYVLAHLSEMVVKETSLSGGYGMLIGPHATPEELNQFKNKILSEPHRYIAQPTINLSRMPCVNNNSLVPCHIDLRPYVISGADERVSVLPGGLTRVALKPGSLVVNSSQGGGSKDTWVLTEKGCEAH